MMPDYGEADFPLRNLPHLWGRGTAAAVEGALVKVTLTVRHKFPPATHRKRSPTIAFAMKVSHWIFARYAHYKSSSLTFPSKEGGLVGCFSGSAADGILMTLSPKHAIDSAVGSLR